MTATPSVSVIVPTWNDACRPLEALTSVRSQTHEDWEALVVDDGSATDVQTALANGIAALNDPRIRLLQRRRNGGPAQARNLGIRLARGRYLAFLDADDLWHPEKLARQLAAMQASGAALSCTAYENLNERTGRRSLRVPPEMPAYEALLGHNTIGCSTVILDRVQIGRSYFPDIRMRQDFAHWLRLLRQGVLVQGLADPLTTRRLHARALSANKLRAALYTWRMYRDIEGLDFPVRLRCFLVYATGGLLERVLRRG